MNLIKKLCLIVGFLFISGTNVYAECVAEFGSNLYKSNNKQYVATISYVTENGIKDKSVKLYDTKNDSTVTYSLGFKQSSRRSYVLDDGHLVYVASYCGPMSADSVAVAVYSPKGRLIWKKTIDEILPKIPGLYSQGIDSSSWFSNINEINTSRISDAVLKLTLIDQNKLDVNLLTGKTEYTELPLIQILMDPDKALRKAYNLRRPSSDEDMVNLLEKIVMLHPTHYESAAVLAEKYARKRKFSAAIKIIMPFTIQQPIDDSIVRDEVYYINHRSVLDKHRNLANLFLKNKEFNKAEAIYKSLYDLRPNNSSVVSSYTDTLFHLNRNNLAKEIIDKYNNKQIKSFTGEKYSLSSIQSNIENNNRVLRKHEENELSQKYLDSLDSLHSEKTDARYYLSRAEAYIMSGDMQKAIAYYEKAAVNNRDISAENELAKIYFDANGVGQDLEKTFYWYRKIAEKIESHDYVPYNTPYYPLCHFYLQNQSSKNDIAESFKWCEKSAKNDESAGMFWLAIHYGDKSSQFYNHKKSIEYLKKADKENYPSWGTGRLPSSYPPNTILKSDFAWADNVLSSNKHVNEALSLRILGQMYMYGYGAEKDVVKANEYIKKSAHKGDAVAMSSFASLKRNSREYKDAYKWYLKAAEKGYIWAHIEMAKMQMHGLIGEVNLELAEYQLNLYTEKDKKEQEDKWKQFVSENPFAKRSTPSEYSNHQKKLYDKLETLKQKSK